MDIGDVDAARSVIAKLETGNEAALAGRSQVSTGIVDVAQDLVRVTVGRIIHSSIRVVVIAGQVGVSFVNSITSRPDVTIRGRCAQVALHVAELAAGNIGDVDTSRCGIAEADALLEGGDGLSGEIAAGIVNTAHNVIRCIGRIVYDSIVLVVGTIERGGSEDSRG